MSRVIDAHVHVWDPRVLHYPWLANVPALNAPRLPGDIDDADGRVSEWIFVEADAAPRDAAAEVAWVRARDWPGLRAIVAAADLTGTLPPAGEPMVAGVRHILEGFASRALPSRLADGLVRLAERGLVFDACVRWQQLSALHALLQAVERPPTIVLDHLGKPPVDEGITSGEGRSWRAQLHALARVPGLHVKLSGLPAEASSPEALRRHGPDFVRAAVDVFGPDRCMFGSDWPVSARGGIAVAEWLDLVIECSGGSVDEVVSRTARRVYGIEDATP